MVYDVTNPRAHMIKRITKIVQSMFNSFIENQPCRVSYQANVRLSSSSKLFRLNCDPSSPALTGQSLVQLQVIADLPDALDLRGNRARARLSLGGLDFTCKSTMPLLVSTPTREGVSRPLSVVL
jgi:hypothetical protein